MYIIWAKRNIVDIYETMGLANCEVTLCFCRQETFVRELQAQQYTTKDILVICENKAQRILKILRAITVEHLPKAIVVITEDPANIWLSKRIPEYLHKLLTLTTEPEHVKFV